jgi:hypothetical protein
MDHGSEQRKWAFDIGAGAMMRRKDHHGDIIPRVGDVVESRAIPNDPGTVIKILQVNANGATCVAVKWFVWDNSRTTEEYVSELRIVSEV